MEKISSIILTWYILLIFPGLIFAGIAANYTPISGIEFMLLILMTLIAGMCIVMALVSGITLIKRTLKHSI